MTIQLTSSGNPFVVGEIPVPLIYSFKDSAGAAIDLLNYAARFTLREKYGNPFTFNATVTNHTTGEVTYTWTGGEFNTPGHWLAEVWVGNGTQRFASELIEFDVRAAVGAVPAI